jgi:hypothetical protein
MRAPKRTKRLLSIDWDYWFDTGTPIRNGQAQLYDWGHRESAWFTNEIWTIRASSFMQQKLPLPGVWGDPLAFWQRVTFAEKAELWVADSHLGIAHARVERGVREVVGLDAHHDSYTPLNEIFASDRVDCGNWTVLYFLRDVPVEVRYPAWNAERAKTDVPHIPMRWVPDDDAHLGTFDRVFIARSGAWTPPWIDAEFKRFVEAAPLAPQVVPGYEDPMVVREWDEAEAHHIVANWEQLKLMKGLAELF